MDDLSIRSATKTDVALIWQFIKDLALYERLSDAVTATPEGLDAALFGASPTFSPAAEVLIAELGSTPVGFAVFFHNFSTFLGQRGLYLEDLFVKPEWRGRGFGTRLLVRVAQIAVERGCGRMEWSVLNWNELALRVYRRIGAVPMNEWTVQRLTGDALKQLAELDRT